MTKEITDNNFENLVLKSANPVLVDFWAPWCGPCRQLGPIIEELSKEMEGKIDIYKMNIDENPEAPSKYAIRSIPTLMIFKNGKIVDTKLGVNPKNVIISWIEKNII